MHALCASSETTSNFAGCCRSTVGLRVQVPGSMNSKSQLAADGAAWLGNVSTSVAIIFVNKVLMNVSGYGFRYGAQSAPLLDPSRPA